MPLYELRAFCSKCGGFHDTSVRIPLEEVFSIQSVGSIYGEGKLPPVVEIAMSQEFRCSKTGEFFKQASLARLVLVAPGAAREED
jgi:hypothetical protein